MRWTEGHVWVVENLLVQSSSFFTYKYVVMAQNKAVKWERGPNRLADLEILPDLNRVTKQQNSFSNSRSMDSRHSGMKSSLSPQVKAVLLKDDWEHFTVRFSVHSTFDAPVEEDAKTVASNSGSKDSYMRIIGSLPELTKSGSVGSGPLRMK